MISKRWIAIAGLAASCATAAHAGGCRGGPGWSTCGADPAFPEQYRQAWAAYYQREAAAQEYHQQAIRQLQLQNAINQMALGAAIASGAGPSALPYGAYRLPSNTLKCTYGGGYMQCH
jgi:hypothetical protein